MSPVRESPTATPDVLQQRHSCSTDLRDVGEVQGGRGGEDVGVVFGAGLLEAVQGGVAEVLGQSLVLVAFTGKLDTHVLGHGDAYGPAVKLLAVQVAHGCGDVEA